MSVYVYVCLCVCVCMSVSVCVRVYVNTHAYRVARIEQTETPQMMEQRVKTSESLPLSLLPVLHLSRALPQLLVLPSLTVL